MPSRKASEFGRFLSETPARKRRSTMDKHPQLREVIVEYVTALDGHRTQVSAEQLAAWIRGEMGLDLSPSAVRGYVREVRDAAK